MFEQFFRDYLFFRHSFLLAVFLIPQTIRPVEFFSSGVLSTPFEKFLRFIHIERPHRLVTFELVAIDKSYRACFRDASYRSLAPFSLSPVALRHAEWQWEDERWRRSVRDSLCAALRSHDIHFAFLARLSSTSRRA